MSIAALLLQIKFISHVGAKPISVNKFLIQRSLHKPFAIPLNSALALDKACIEGSEVWMDRACKGVLNCRTREGIWLMI